VSARGEAQSAAGVREGAILAGKYRIERVLGVGGMGAVLAARHLQLDTLVALKFLLPAMLQDEEAVARFAREARNAVRITSEHVARVLDVGTLANGAPFLGHLVVRPLQPRQRGIRLPGRRAVRQPLRRGGYVLVLRPERHDRRCRDLLSGEPRHGRVSVTSARGGLQSSSRTSATAARRSSSWRARAGGSLFASPPTMRRVQCCLAISALGLFFAACFNSSKTTKVEPGVTNSQPVQCLGFGVSCHSDADCCTHSCESGACVAKK
jgi:hypothetical protein